MDCTTALFFHWLWKGEQRIPLTSEEVRSMGSLGCFFFFLNLRGIKIYIRKKLLGFGWIPLDPGNRQWKRRVGAITVQAEKMELQRTGLGACFMEWDTCHQELHCVKHSALIRTPEELEQEWSTQSVTNGY